MKLPILPRAGSLTLEFGKFCLVQLISFFLRDRKDGHFSHFIEVSYLFFFLGKMTSTRLFHNCNISDLRKV